MIACGVARADGFSATAEPGYSHVETEVTDQAGDETEESADLLTQRYRLSLDRSLTDRLDLAGGATILEDRGWRRTDGVWSDAHRRSTSYYGRLTLGIPVLSAGLGVDRREQRVLEPFRPALVTDAYTAYASWRPLDLPELDLRLGRVNAYDRARRTRDSTTDSASLTARYDAPRWDARYVLGWNRAHDRLRRTETTGVDQTVLGTRNDTRFGGRTTTYLSAMAQSRNTLTEAGAGGTVTRQQLPVAGLSAVEAFPATPENVVLQPNPLVVDGNLTASASVNVGFGPSALGDRDLRDVGARFGDAVTPVNTLYLWLDRAPTPEVAAALAATVQVWSSDDNERWTPVAIATPPAPSAFENRLELGIPRTEARLLKVTLRPLAAGVTTDAAFRDLFVTELQLLLVVPAESVPRRQSGLAVSATAFARTIVLRAPELAHDLSATVSHDSEAPRVRYSVVNGLSVQKRLRPSLTGNARAARQDQDAGRGHEGSFLWSAALVGTPLPTAFWTVTYSGSARDSGGGEDLDDDGIGDEGVIGHSISALGRADWYEGISSQATAAASISTDGIRTAQTGQVSGTTSLTPNPWVTLSAGGLYSRSLASDPLLGDVVTEFARVDGRLSLTPAPALSAAGTVSRVLLGTRPTTLGTLQLNWFPLRGELQLSLAYSNTLDTAAEATTELFTPSLRWNVRRGVSLTASYTFLETDAPAQLLVSRAFATTLLITL